MSVRTIVKSIQDIMRQDTGVDGDAQRISQLCWMFFLKIIDDQDQELELLNADYRSPLPKKGSSGNRVDESNGKCGLKPHGYWVAGVGAELGSHRAGGAPWRGGPPRPPGP